MTEQSTGQSIRPLGALERLFASYVEAGAMFFAIPVMVKGHLTAQVLNEALAKTQARHRLLNVTIGYSADDQLSFIESAAPITARLIQGSEEQLSNLLATEVNTPFDSATGPLMRLTSMVGDENTILVGTFHHSIADGRSGVRVMVDLLSFIGGLELSSINGFEALDILMGGEAHRFPELSATERARVQVELLPQFEKSVVRIADYSVEESRKLFSAAKSNGTSVHSALTVAFARAQLAIGAAKDGQQLRVMSPVDVKPLIGLTDQMGAFVSIAVLPFEKNDSPFWEAARSVSASIAPYRTRQATQGFIAAKVCESVGAMDRHGIRVRRLAITEEEWADSAAHGFDILHRGEEDFRSFLRSLLQKFYETNTDMGGPSFYGHLYDMLNHKSAGLEYEPIRNIMRDVTLDAIPIGPGNTFFGPVKERRLHSVYTASRDFSVRPEFFRSLLIASGVVEADASERTFNRILVKATVMEDFVRSAKDTVNFKTVEKMLGIGRFYIKQLTEQNILKTFNGLVHFSEDSDLAPKFCPVLSSLQRFWVAVFGAVAAGCGAEPFRLRSTASRRGLIV